jgi:hypothetical protein
MTKKERTGFAGLQYMLHYCNKKRSENKEEKLLWHKLQKVNDYATICNNK